MKKVIKLTESDLVRLIKKVILEQDMSVGGKIRNNINKDLVATDILIVKDKNNEESTLEVVGTQPSGGFSAKDSRGKIMKFIIGTADNQIRFPQSLPGDFVYTVLKVKIGTKTADVDASGNYSF